MAMTSLNIKTCDLLSSKTYFIIEILLFSFSKERSDTLCTTSNAFALMLPLNKKNFFSLLFYPALEKQLVTSFTGKFITGKQHKFKFYVLI